MQENEPDEPENLEQLIEQQYIVRLRQRRTQLRRTYRRDIKDDVNVDDDDIRMKELRMIGSIIKLLRG